MIFRSGTLSSILPSSLTGLNVGMILDLRSRREIDAQPDPIIEGIENVWVGASQKPKEIDLVTFAEGGGVEAYADMYMEILETYGGAWKRGLEWSGF